MAQTIKANTTKTTFSRETTVSVSVAASPAVVWTLLTTGVDMPRWNSTIVSLKGRIAENERIELVSILDEKRVFKLKIKEFVPEKRLVWGDSQGNRVYTIEQNTADSVTVTMREKIGGLMFPLYSRFLPSFDASFEQFAKDLKHEAEARQHRVTTHT